MIKYLQQTDEVTRRRMDLNDLDYYLNLEIKGVSIGNTNKIRWQILTDNDNYDAKYIAEILEKVIEVIKSE